MSDIFLSLILGLVQGLTEFLPISSSAHLLIPSLLFGANDLGLEFDKEANAKKRGIELEMNTPDSKVKALVVPTDEELVIARDTYKILKGEL